MARKIGVNIYHGRSVNRFANFQLKMPKVSIMVRVVQCNVILLCQQAQSDILTFLQEMQKRDFKFKFEFLSSFAKIINNSTPDY